MNCSIDRIGTASELHTFKTVDTLNESPDFNGKDISEIEEEHDVKHIKTFFVDSSGFGKVGEAALTYKQFQDEVDKLLKKHKTLKSCLTGIGQFQVYVSIFK